MSCALLVSTDLLVAFAVKDSFALWVPLQKQCALRESIAVVLKTQKPMGRAMRVTIASQDRLSQTLLKVCALPVRIVLQGPAIQNRVRWVTIRTHLVCLKVELL